MARLAAFACAALISAPGLASAASWGLVVGVDDYVYQRPLTGAVNDARDIARAMQSREMADVVVLLNQAATRSAIEAAWRDLLERAAPGDTIIFTYAGHGGQEPDLSGDEALSADGDGFDEAFLLADFTPKTARGARERIVDDELNAWFAAAAGKGVRVTFLADSCHAGTMTRQAISTRFAGSFDPPAGAEIAAPDTSTAPLDNVFFIAAVSEDKATPEVNIGGVMRGAASYAFARALEGAADADADGVVTRDELDDYMTRAAATFSDQALPRVSPLSGGGEPVFGGRARATAKKSKGKAASKMTLSLSSGGMIGAPTAEISPAFGAATLNWIQDERRVLNSEGDVVAYDVGGPIALRRVMEKFRLIEQVKAAAAAAPLSVGLSGGAKLHRVGEETEIVIGPRRAPYLTVVALGDDGEASLIYPFTAAEAGPQNPDAAIRFAVEITEDGAGAEHVLALATDAPPQDLREALSAGGPARAFAPLMAALLDGRRVEAGVGRLLTAK